MQSTSCHFRQQNREEKKKEKKKHAKIQNYIVINCQNLQKDRFHLLVKDGGSTIAAVIPALTKPFLYVRIVEQVVNFSTRLLASSVSLRPISACSGIGRTFVFFLQYFNKLIAAAAASEKISKQSTLSSSRVFAMCAHTFRAN